MKLKDLIEKHTVDGVVNYEEAETAFQTHINGVATKTAKSELGKFKNEYVGTFINELGIEGNTIDDVKGWVKSMSGNSDEIKKENVTLNKTLSELQGKYDTLNKEYTNTTQLGLLKEIGKTGEEAEFLQYKFNKEVTDEVSFNDLVTKYAKENKVGTFRKAPQDFSHQETSSPLEAFQKLQEQK